MFLLEILMTVAAYLLGSLSAALIVSKKFNMPDPRGYGSGNPGASNMMRSGRKDAAAWTLLGDALKGLIAVLIARCLYAAFDDMSAAVVAWAAVAAVIGHMYPVFFGFKGGKGVATALGVLLGMSFWATFWVVLIWLTIAFKFKKSSLAALIAAACAPWITFIVLRGHHVTSWGWAVLVIAILVIYRHKDNIKRLCQGEELGVEKSASFATAASAATPSVATPSTQQDEVAQTVAPTEKESETIDVAPLTEATEIDVKQADLRDGDALEEAVIQAAAQKAQEASKTVAAQESTAAPAPQPLQQIETIVQPETATENTTEESQTNSSEQSWANAETAAKPKKRGRKKAAE